METFNIFETQKFPQQKKTEQVGKNFGDAARRC